MRKLRNHNTDCQNGADRIVAQYAKRTLNEFPGEIIGCEMGIAWGGNVQTVGEMWKGRGKYYGFDTFTGMPKHLGVPKEYELLTRPRGGHVFDYIVVDCMDAWYARCGTNELSYEYQRGVLDENGLDNVILVKGEVDEKSCDSIPYLNYAFLDMDLLVPMMKGYEAVKNKVVRGGYLLLHDVIDNLELLMAWYESTIKGRDGAMWQVLEEIPSSYIAILRRK